MDKEFVPYQESLELKELGFDEKCLSCYLYEVETFSWELNYQIPNNSIPWIISAPLYQQAFRFFRDKYNIYVKYIKNDSESHIFSYKMDDACYKLASKRNNYEEAELECLKKLIKIVKNK